MLPCELNAAQEEGTALSVLLVVADDAVLELVLWVEEVLDRDDISDVVAVDDKTCAPVVDELSTTFVAESEEGADVDEPDTLLPAEVRLADWLFVLDGVETMFVSLFLVLESVLELELKDEEICVSVVDEPLAEFVVVESEAEADLDEPVMLVPAEVETLD